jgi:Protein of unknown function (DUF1573)/Flagellar-associated PapD-like
MHFSVTDVRSEVKRTVPARTRCGLLMAAALAALAVGLGTAGAVAAQSSDLAVGGLSSGPASNGGNTDSSSGGANGLQLGGANASGAPKAAVAGKDYNFGSVLNGVPVSHIFKIHNAGTGTLIIGAVQTSCGCTAAKPTRNDLAPGEDSDIAVSFDTRFDKGPATRTVTVYTNDPAAKEIVLTLKGDVKVQVEAAPAQVAFGDVKYATAQSRQVVLNDLVGGADPHAVQNFKVQSLSNANPNIRVTEAPRTDGKAGAVLTVALLKTMPVGAFDDTVKVATSRAPVDITVFGTVQGDLTVKPAQVSFGVVPHHQGTLRFVRLVNEGARPVKVTGVSSSNVSVSATIEPVSAGKEYKITLALQPNSPDGTLHGQIAITTDDPEQQTLNLPFYGIVGSFRG